MRHTNNPTHLWQSAEALAAQVSLDGYYMLAMHARMLQMVNPWLCNAAERLLYDLADRYGYVPRSNRQANDDEDLPF